MLRTSARQALLLIGLMAFSINGLSCSCDRVGIVKNKKSTDFVFKGRVLEVRESAITDTIANTNEILEYRQTRYTFNILRHYKGLAGKETVDLMQGVTDCAVSFEKGKTYIVYAFLDNRKLHYRLENQTMAPYITAHLCSRTKKTAFLTFWESFLLWLT